MVDIVFSVPGMGMMRMMRMRVNTGRPFLGTPSLGVRISGVMHSVEYPNLERIGGDGGGMVDSAVQSSPSLPSNLS